MSTLVNNILSIVAPKGAIPDLATEGKTPLALQKLANFFEACAGGMSPGQPGETRIVISKGRTNARTDKSYQTLALVSVLADTVLEINGVPFSAVNGTATAGNNEFDMSGSDTADATALCAAILASTTLGVYGLVTACNLAATIQCTSVAAGDKVKLEGVAFTATRYATGRPGEFDVSGSDTADAAALAAAINAHGYIGRRYVATSSTDTVTVRQRVGTTGATLNTEATTFTLGGLSSGKLAATSTILLGSTSGQAAGNSFRVITKGVVAAGTVTYVAPSGTQTVTINGVQVYNATAGATAALTAAAVAAAINASTNTAIAGQVRAVARAGVVKVFSVVPGLLGNAMSLAATGTGATASGARLTGGTEASGAGVQASGTVTISSGSGTITATINGVDVAITWASSDTNSATLLAAAINSSTNALVRGLVYASSSAGVVTITAIRGGLPGNNITLAASGTGATASGANLASGAAATSFVPGAELFTGGVGGNDPSPTEYQF